ncbi:MAG: multidrug efflux MFS transporter, partial [Mesorhizobium sp.]
SVIIPVSGWLTSVIGRKRYYMICVATFTLSSLLCGLAPNLPTLIAFRILQGLGGGGMAPSEQSILADTFPPEKRSQAFALYG